jgi:hypothetical protein
VPGQVEVNLPPELAPDLQAVEDSVKEIVLRLKDLKLPPVTMDGMVTLIPPTQHMNMVLNALAQLCAGRITNGIQLGLQEIQANAKMEAQRLTPVDTPPD